MATLLGRSDEQEILQQVLHSDQPEFLALYGRRRVGKTYLIKTFFEQQNCYYFCATGIQKGTLNEQIRVFTQAISQAFYPGVEIKEKDNWFDVLESLTQTLNSVVPKGKTIVLFFDEFPWMATRKSHFMEALEYYWNQYWSTNAQIKLIICGSSASWIIRKIINNKGGLHNRITRKIHLKPFKLKDVKQFLQKMGTKLKNKHIAEIYMVTGGIPYYLAQIKKGMSSTQVIESLVFQKNGLLLKEFDNLFSSLFDDADAHIEFLKIIAKHRYGVSQKTLIEESQHCKAGGTATKKLNELIEAGFIMQFKPYLNKKKGIYYRIIDEYTNFYLQWIEPLKNTLQNEALDEGYWAHAKETGAWKAWAGYAFESICYQHLSEIRKALKLNPMAIPHAWQYKSKNGSTEKGAQIDLLFDRRDAAITVCEIKFTELPFTLNKQEADNLTNKVDVFLKQTKSTKQIFLALISASGVKPSMYSEEMIANVVTLDDLFNN